TLKGAYVSSQSLRPSLCRNHAAMPAAFRPNGTVANHGAAGTFAAQKSEAEWPDSTVPWEVASKTPSGGMSCPAGDTSIRDRPALISSTALASRWAEPSSTSAAGGETEGMRHWALGWAKT